MTYNFKKGDTVYFDDLVFPGIVMEGIIDYCGEWAVVIKWGFSFSEYINLRGSRIVASSKKEYYELCIKREENQINKTFADLEYRKQKIAAFKEELEKV